MAEITIGKGGFQSYVSPFEQATGKHIPSIQEKRISEIKSRSGSSYYSGGQSYTSVDQQTSGESKEQITLIPTQEKKLQSAQASAEQKAIAIYKKNLQKISNYNKLRPQLQIQAQARALKPAQNYYKKAIESFYKKEYPVGKVSIKTPSAPAKTEPINIFKPDSYFNLIEDLNKSKSKRLNTGAGKIVKQTTLAVGSLFGYSIANINALPSFAKDIVKNPKNIKNIPKDIYSDLKDTWQLLKVSGTRSQAIGKIGSYYVVGKITNKGFKATGRITGKAVTKLDPYFVGEAKIGTKLVIPNEPIRNLGITKLVKRSVEKGLGIKQVSKQATELKVVGRIPTESIASQLKKSGTKVSAISSQADALLNIIKNEKVIRKPIPNETKLSASAKKLLNKFDKGKITPSELVRLDKAIKKVGGKGILERSFFADPNLRIRPSRLGISTKDGTIKDLLSGRASLKGKKPQILLFKNIKVETFPKSFKDIKSSLKKGKPLTESQTKRLLEFQLKKSGKFKPLGFVTRESEITLASGEVIKRGKKVGVTLVEGKRVPIIEAEVVKVTGNLKNLLNKAKRGTASAKDLKTLKRGLKKKTGFDYSLSSLKKAKLKYPLGRKVLSSGVSKAVSYKTKTLSYKPSQIKYTSSGKPYIKTPIGSRFISPSKTGKSGKISYRVPYYPKSISGYPTKKSPIYKSPKYPPYKIPIPTKTPPKKIFVRGTKKTKKLSKAVPTFNVYAKTGRKFVKVNKGVLTRQDALSKGTFVVDNTTSRTFKIVPAGKKKEVNLLPQPERNYYKRASHKLRGYRIKRGKKFGLTQKYIERGGKKGYTIDTLGEKRQLSVAKYLKERKVPRQSSVKKTTPKRKITPSQKKVMLKNLAKARRVLERKRS